MQYKFIAIEGNIGAGKTTLADKLAKSQDAQLVLEEFADNPFLEDFYRSPQLNAFAVETAFLLDRCRQLKQVFSPNSLRSPVIADYVIDKALVFSAITLNQKQFTVFKELYELLTESLPKPDLIIYLHNHVDQLRKNIQNRGRSYESLITKEYLSMLENSYSRFFTAQKSIPVLYIDLSGSPFLSDNILEENITSLLEQRWEAGVNHIRIEKSISQ